MIDWLREKFASAISILYYIWVIFSTILGGIQGYVLGKALSGWQFSWAGTGCFLGFVFGLIGGIVSGILIYGFAATVIHISETNDAILLKLFDILSAKNTVSPSVNTKTSLGNTVSTQQTTNTTEKMESKKDNDPSTTTKSAPTTDVWVCTKCGATNPVGSILCQNCGC